MGRVATYPSRPRPCCITSGSRGNGTLVPYRTVPLTLSLPPQIEDDEADDGDQDASGDVEDQTWYCQGIHDVLLDGA